MVVVAAVAAAFLPSLKAGNLSIVSDEISKCRDTNNTTLIEINDSSQLPLSTIIGFLCVPVNAVTRVHNQSSQQFNHLLDHNEASLRGTSNLLSLVLLGEIVIATRFTGRQDGS